MSEMATYTLESSTADQVKKNTRKSRSFHNITYRGLEFGGTCTGEHGVGLSKVNYLVDELGPDTVDLMHTIKQTLDPLNLLNPGKIFTKESIERGRELERKGMLGKYKYYKFEKGKPGYFEDEEEEGK